MLIIDGFRIDVETDGSHSFSAEITDHEVEEGAEIGDHIDLHPIEVTVTGVVSSHPIGEVAGLRGEDPVREAYEKMLEIRAARELVVIQTSLDVFRRMGLMNVDVPTSAETGTSFQFTATFKQINIVTNERTTIPVAVPQAASKVRKGKKPVVSETVVLRPSPFIGSEASANLTPDAKTLRDAEGYKHIDQISRGNPALHSGGPTFGFSEQ
jgi:hypothetical protein